MKQKYINAYMKTAETFAELSSAVRLKVGAIIVKDNRIISIGYNGTPSGWDNTCESKVWMDDLVQTTYDVETLERLYPYEAYSDEDDTLIGRYQLTTKPEVIHAESNAISKLAKSTESGDNSVLFVTHAPCLDCAKLVYRSGINSVFYRNSYRSEDGIKFLEKSGVNVKKVLDI